jgi:plastocyanin
MEKFTTGFILCEILWGRKKWSPDTMLKNGAVPKSFMSRQFNSGNMKRLLLSLLLMAWVTAGFSKVWTVTNAGNTFNPATLSIMAGDSVKFTLGSMHNSVEVSQATWNANGNTALPGGFQTPFGGGLVLPAKLSAGTHYYVCSPHAALGMKGQIIVTSTVGMNETPSMAGMSVFPNPSDGNFELKVDDTRNMKSFDLVVYDLAGNKAFESLSLKPQESYRIDISDRPRGVYIVRLNSADGVITRKIIVR